jgi:hypothetical protein
MPIFSAGKAGKVSEARKADKIAMRDDSLLRLAAPQGSWLNTPICLPALTETLI